MFGLKFIITTLLFCLTHSLTLGNGRVNEFYYEKTLTTSNVNSSSFGKLWSVNVTGNTFAQPLIVKKVDFNGTSRDIMLIATMLNYIYAFDINTQAQLWSHQVETPCAFEYNPPCNCIFTDVGIIGTPVVDEANGVFFFVTHVCPQGTNYTFHLHRASLTTGNDLSTAVITGTTRGNLTFNSEYGNQRMSLTLLENTVYIAFSSYCDDQPYAAWIFLYNATTLQQDYATVVSASQGGLWASGAAFTVDEDGFIYLSVGNGRYNVSTDDYSQSVVKLQRKNTNGVFSVSIVDYFTPYNWQTLNNNDWDLGSDAVTLIPTTRDLVVGGKEGKIYILDRDNLGKVGDGNDNQIKQAFQVTVPNPSYPNYRNIHHHLVYNSSDGLILYVWGEQDYFKMFKYSSGKFTSTPSSQSKYQAPQAAMPGGFLSCSSNNGTKGSGIIWANIPISGDANKHIVAGVLRAFNPDDLTNEIWNSEMNSARDSYGNIAKYVPPLVVDGKVYIPTFSNQIVVYGLLK